MIFNAAKELGQLSKLKVRLGEAAEEGASWVVGEVSSWDGEEGKGGPTAHAPCTHCLCSELCVAASGTARSRCCSHAPSHACWVLG